MKFTSTVILSLRVRDSQGKERTRFFKSESISLSCEEEEGNPAPGWSVKRQSIELGNGSCRNGTIDGFGSTKGGASCDIHLYQWDNGVYWCQSQAGDLSDRIDISVSDVILEILAPPVVEGSNATLRCLFKTTGEPSSNSPADFFRNGSIIFSTESPREMTIHNVSKSHEGFYKCNITGLGGSPDIWMEVGNSSSSPAPDTEPTSEPKKERPMSVLHAIVHVLLPIPWLVSTFLYMGILRDRARARARAFVRGGDNNDVIMAIAV